MQCNDINKKTPSTTSQEKSNKAIINKLNIYSSPRVSLLSFVLSKLRFSSSSVSYLSSYPSHATWQDTESHLYRLPNLRLHPHKLLRMRVGSLLDLSVIVVVLEEADDGADAAGAETVGRVADCGNVC